MYSPGGAVHGRGDKVAIVVPESTAIRNWYHPSCEHHHFPNPVYPDYDITYRENTSSEARVYTSDLLTNYSLDGGATWGDPKRSKCLDPHPRKNASYDWYYDSITCTRIKLGSYGNDVYAMMPGRRYYKPAGKHAHDCWFNHLLGMRGDHFKEHPDPTVAQGYASVPIGIMPGWSGDLTLIDDGILSQSCIGGAPVGTQFDSSECYAFAIGDTQLCSIFANGSRENVVLSTYPSVSGYDIYLRSLIDFTMPPLPPWGNRSFWW